MQGGAISAISYILYVSKITENLPSQVKISQFADDIALYIPTSDPHTDKEILENSINIINNNLTKIVLKLSVPKTKLLHFNKHNELPAEIELNIFETIIKSVEFVRFLGILFDYRLSFNKHISYIIEKCNRSINIIKLTRGT